MPEIRILTAQRAVTAAGTPEKIKEASEFHKNKVIAIRIRAKVSNAGDIYITSTDQRASASSAGDILAPGEVHPIDVHDFVDGYLDLAEIWIDAANSGDGISYMAIEVI